MTDQFRPVPYREPEPVEKIWVQPDEENEHRADQDGEATYRNPPEVESRNSSVYQAWGATSAGAKGGLWNGTWGRQPGMIWRLFTDEEYNVPPPQNILSIQSAIRQAQG